MSNIFLPMRRLFYSYSVKICALGLNKLLASICTVWKWRRFPCRALCRCLKKWETQEAAVDHISHRQGSKQRPQALLVKQLSVFVKCFELLLCPATELVITSCLFNPFVLTSPSEQKKFAVVPNKRATVQNVEFFLFNQLMGASTDDTSAPFPLASNDHGTVHYEFFSNFLYRSVGISFDATLKWSSRAGHWALRVFKTLVFFPKALQQPTHSVS